jgi:hypothetical protein
MIFRCALLALLSLAAPLEAQKNCKKGIPCGNMCISAKNVCHIGPTAASEAKPAPRAAMSTLAVRDDGAPWVAFRDGSIFYRNVMGCEAARVPPNAERVYFRTAEDAKSAGLVPSKESGCQ